MEEINKDKLKEAYTLLLFNKIKNALGIHTYTIGTINDK